MDAQTPDRLLHFKRHHHSRRPICHRTNSLRFCNTVTTCSLFRTDLGWSRASKRRFQVPRITNARDPKRREFDAERSDCYHSIAGWSSLVARWAHNPKVGGSNPPPATNAIIRLRQLGTCNDCPKLSNKGNCHTVPLIY